MFYLQSGVSRTLASFQNTSSTVLFKIQSDLDVIFETPVSQELVVWLAVPSQLKL